MSRLANVLIVAGVVILLAVSGYVGWQMVRGQQLRNALQQTPAPSATATPMAQAIVPTNPPASPIPTPSPVPTQPPAPTTVSATVVPASQPTATSAPTATPVIPMPSPIPMLAAPPVRLVIPDPNITVDAPVVEMSWEVVQTANGPQSEWVIPKNEAGHHVNSAQLGEQGNLVISGHNNIYGRVFEAISLAWPPEASASKRVDDFTDRSDILNGRTIQLYDAAGRRFDYTITEFYRLQDTGVSLEQRIANGRFMQPTDDTTLTLVTCWPIWSNTHRLIVVAKPVKPS